MIDADGYPVLVDFGCSKYCPDKTYTFIGTPNYVAPEIITNAGHNRCVDYWALGVTVYEMMTGENPFFFDGMDQGTLYRAICEEKYYPLSEGKSANSVDFIDRLLEKNPAQRLGMLSKGADDVFEHPWLEGLDLVKIRAKQWNAPRRVPQTEDKDSEDIVLEKLGMRICSDDSIKSRDVRHADDSTASFADPSDRDLSMRSIREEDDLGSLVEEEVETTKAEKKKKAKNTKKNKNSDCSQKKKITDPASEYQFVTPTTVTYYTIKKPIRNLSKRAKDKEESKSRRSVLRGTLRDLGVDSDEDDDFHRYLAQK
jgi:serine/threonine protein kinase